MYLACRRGTAIAEACVVCSLARHCREPLVVHLFDIDLKPRASIESLTDLRDRESWSGAHYIVNKSI